MNSISVSFKCSLQRSLNVWCTSPDCLFVLISYHHYLIIIYSFIQLISSQHHIKVHSAGSTLCGYIYVFNRVCLSFDIYIGKIILIIAARWNDSPKNIFWKVIINVFSNVYLYGEKGTKLNVYVLFFRILKSGVETILIRWKKTENTTFGEKVFQRVNIKFFETICPIKKF